MTATVLTVIMALFGTQFPNRSMPMDSKEACEAAKASMDASDFAKNIKAVGGTYDVTCTTTTK